MMTPQTHLQGYLVILTVTEVSYVFVISNDKSRLKFFCQMLLTVLWWF